MPPQDRANAIKKSKNQIDTIPTILFM